MPHDGFPNKKDLEKQKGLKEHRDAITAMKPGERLKMVHKITATSWKDMVQKRGDELLGTKEGEAEMKRHQNELLTLQSSGVNSPKTRLGILYRHNLAWTALGKKFDEGLLTPIEEK